jgi:hypothetical protein
VVGDVLVDSEVLFVTDVMNLKIKLIQFFKCVHRCSMYAYVFIDVSDHMRISIYICNIYFFKKKCPLLHP